jgi:hypothetical protein
MTDGLNAPHALRAISTSAVGRRTTALLLRFRYDVVAHTIGDERRLLAEEAGVVAFAGTPRSTFEFFGVIRMRRQHSVLAANRVDLAP